MGDHGHASGHDSQQSSPQTPKSFIDSEHESDRESCATTVAETVMAEQVTNHVVKEAQSVGRPAPIDDTASTTKTPAVNGELPSGSATTSTNPLEAPHTAATADGVDAAPADRAHVSDKAHSKATPASDQQQADASPNESKPAFLNGDSGHHSASESQAVADASGGSDTDISRPGSVDQSKRDIGHVRTNSSLKKPSTFKSVSVTKTFLAKSAVSTPITRPGEKAAPAVQPSSSALLTPKPRLVAKLGTGNAPRTLGKVNGAGAGPDASKVWNKNQPVPLPPPKQFTDEELKQQYGIHLATRLQADEAGKEAKWADIDDDEDDWAPEAVQWMDGTKSSVAAAENQPPPAEEPKTILKPETPAETPTPAPATATNTPKPTVTGGTKTILKPGAHSQPATGKSSLVLKGQPEKPTLVAKPSATEKKSPWASLPPIEKVPPVQINPPSQQPPAQRFSQRESYGYDSLPPALAKEIAPDDFNRSWRDDRSSRPELYNSQSGRYEPVNDMRRGSIRDAGFRQQPSVLQRPSHEGPAEPSAAFQTSRSSADMPTWGRRRNSSNVSGEQARRMSIDRRAPDMPRGPMNTERRESQSVNGLEPSDLGAPRQPPLAQAVSPHAAHAHPTSPYGSVTSSVTHDLPAQNAAATEDPVEAQKRLMADKIERARLKKQQEQEAEKQAEAERKERIAKRIAALGPPPEAKSKIKEPSPSRAPQPSPQKEKAVPASVQSPPKPPVPTADGEVAQYGMIKVHHAQPIKKPSSPITAVNSAEPASGPSPVKAQTENQARASPSLNQHSAQPFDTFTRDNEKSRQPVEQSNNLVPQSEGVIPAGAKPQAPQAAWSPATAPQPRPWASHVWGPPATKERALGNGTFGSSYSRGQPRSASQQQLPVQSGSSTAPIGLSLAPQPSVTSQSASQLPSSQPMYSHSESLPVQATAPSRPGPIAPPAVRGWGNFHEEIRKDDKRVREKERQDRDRLGEAFRPEIRETYKDQRGQAQATLHDKAAGNAALSEGNIKKDAAVKHVHEAPSPQQSLAQNTPLQQAAGPRASRFFPRPTETATQAATTTSSKAESPPPPPETETHPAFTGDTSHPLVRLPKPSPVVRLPPSATGNDVQAETSVSMPSRGQALGARPLAMNPEWQARFNKLLEKPGSTGSASLPASIVRNASASPSIASSKPGALAPAALSKASLDVRGAAGPATVSLPNAPHIRTFANDRGREVITRKGAEALFEDREFGSLPTVRLSKAAHLAANEPAVPPPKDDSHSRFKKFENPFTIRRLEVFDIERLAQKIDVVIHMPNMRDAILKSMPRKRRGPKTNSQFKPKQNTTANGYPAGGSKDRPRKPSQQGQGDRPNNTPRPSGQNAWGSHTRSTPQHQASTWTRRAAAPVH